MKRLREAKMTKIDYTKNCWSCGGPMRNIGMGWYQCDKCQTTYVVLTKLNLPALKSPEENPASGGLAGTPRISKRN